MPQEKRKPSTAAERANEALDRATPEGKTPARRTLDFLLKGSHDEPSSVPLLEQNTPPNTSGTTNKLGTTSTTNTPGTTRIIGETKSTVAPARDFQRVPNSVTRQAMASGLFRGKSKQVWDYLWSQSRAAIVPTRTVRRSRTDIKDGAGLGSINTVDAAVAHLELVGLITRRRIVGESDGNEFEVFTPEEVAEQAFSIPNLPSSTNQTGTTNITQKVVVPVLPESGSTGTTLSTSQSEAYGQSKTSFKTKEEGTDDDAHARPLLSKLIKAEKELTGKISTNDDRWDELGQLLVTELRIAAARTTVSNVPAFLTEHLRRRLWKVDKARATELASTQGEVSQGSDVKNQLSEQERRKCPDCAGVGFWYPEGTEKGVAKCKHASLVPIPEPGNSKGI